MEKFRIHLKQRQKTRFPISHLREEVNEMYGNTIARSSRIDLGFFVLAAFLSLKRGDRSYLHYLIKSNLPKLRRLASRIGSLKRYLKKDEYADLKDELGLTEVLAHDVFFLLLSMVAQADVLIVKFDSFFGRHQAMKKELQDIADEFGREIDAVHRALQYNRIRDFRTDPESGNELDLSKSVYRTVGMRLSRKLDLALQDQTDVVDLRRNSPIDLEFLQYVDVELLFQLWKTFHVGEFILGLQGNPDAAMAFIKQHFSFHINLGEGLPVVFWAWLGTQIPGLGRRNKDRAEVRQELTEAKRNELNSPDVNDLLRVLVNSITRSPEVLQAEIKRIEEQLATYGDERTMPKKELQIKRSLEAEHRKLLNIVVTIEKERDHDVED